MQTAGMNFQTGSRAPPTQKTP
ncbi:MULTISPECIES: hypothetical protein [Enterocloster]